MFPSKNPNEYMRVLKYATKPELTELKSVSAVAGGGLALIGLMGFIIYFVMGFIPM